MDVQVEETQPGPVHGHVQVQVRACVFMKAAAHLYVNAPWHVWAHVLCMRISIRTNLCSRLCLCLCWGVRVHVR